MKTKWDWDHKTIIIVLKHSIPSFFVQSFFGFDFPWNNFIQSQRPSNNAIVSILKHHSLWAVNPSGRFLFSWGDGHQSIIHHLFNCNHGWSLAEWGKSGITQTQKRSLSFRNIWKCEDANLWFFPLLVEKKSKNGWGWYNFPFFPEICLRSGIILFSLSLLSGNSFFFPFRFLLTDNQ